MKIVYFLFLSLIVLINCTQPQKTNTTSANTNVVDSADNFFPVTSFIKGEILQIKSGGITPIKKTLINKKLDSTWLKMTAIDSMLTAFTFPTIDTANCKPFFEEKKFLDQTLNAFTFTYAPKVGISNSFAFTKWDVYVSPETQKVTRVYLVKKEGSKSILQLTWQAGKWCKIVKLTDNTGNKNYTIEKEETISWSYN